MKRLPEPASCKVFILVYEMEKGDLGNKEVRYEKISGIVNLLANKGVGGLARDGEEELLLSL